MPNHCYHIILRASSTKLSFSLVETHGLLVSLISVCFCPDESEHVILSSKSVKDSFLAKLSVFIDFF